MVKLEEAVIARLSAQGANFEVLVDPFLAAQLKEGKSVDMRSVLAIDKVFKDARKGEAASEESMRKVFGETDALKVAEEIIKRGEVQVTTEQRRRMREEKLKHVISIISRRAVNPQTGTPHPPARIEAALKEAKIHVDEFRSAEEQVPRIVKALLPILPLKFETRRIAIKIPPAYVGRAQGVVRKLGTLKQEEWLQDGSWAVLIEIPAGMQAEIYDKLNELTRGEVETRVVE
jgi:ribosome maturation protein SDO1